MPHSFRETGAVRTVAIAMLAASAGLAHGSESGAVATTPHFAFHSDFETNLNDALIEAGRARNDGKPELFQGGTEGECFDGLPPSARAAWNRAVDFYAEIISPKDWTERGQYLIRIDLSGTEELVKAGDRRFASIARSFRGAATPAFEACRWASQDTENRRWIEKLVAVLKAHEETVSRRLADAYEMPLGGLPIRVDVVETVNWAGANTWLLDPAGGHILISKVEPGPESLESVFHEASHTLMGRGAPVRRALQEAAEQLDASLPRDLWHAVLFYSTGEIVRRTLADAGEPDYTHFLYTENIFRRYHAPLESAWPAYLQGERSLAEAAKDLIRALGDAEEDGR